MKNLYHSLLLLIAGSTQKELAAHVRYLKIENQILRSKLPDRVRITRQERSRPVKFGSKLGAALDELVTIVHPGTLRRWIREADKSKRRRPIRIGRPRSREEIRQLIISMARENDWGYSRIMGELKKLGLKPPSRNTVKNILRANGLDPGPKRGAGTWDEFLKIHVATLWQCDFYAKKVLTAKGFRDLYLLVFLHVGSRRVFIAPSTFHPNEAWVKEQGQAFLEHVQETGLGATIVMHDRDSKFTPAFDQILTTAEVRPMKSAYRSPNTVAFVERFIQTQRHECLDFFIVFGQRHMDYLVSEIVAHYHEERPHQSKDNQLLVPTVTAKVATKNKKNVEPEPAVVALSEIGCRQRLGGLLKHYYRKAA